MRTRRSYAWVPDHQLHVASTLAHADQLIATTGDILQEYLRPNPGPLELDTAVRDELAHVIVTAVRPLPDGVARYAADALTSLRAAIEHTLYAEVEHRLGRQLVDREQRIIEMPATISHASFAKWLEQPIRRKLGPFSDSELVKRISDLQPFQRRDVDHHPLRVLAEHTNFAKHRSPVVTTTRLGAVIPDTYQEGLVVRSIGDGGEPVTAGDIIATGPQNVQVPMSIWPQVSIHRPHTGQWLVLMKELGTLEEWVRKVAVPILITGSSSGVDPLPPQLDILVGHADLRTALPAAGAQSAFDRSSIKIEAEIARVGMVDTLVLHSTKPDRSMLEAWADGLDNARILERHKRIASVVRNPRLLDSAVRDLIQEAHRTTAEGS